MVIRLKQEKRALVSSNEASSKMFKEKIEKLKDEVSGKSDEMKKMKVRITNLKNNVSRLEALSKRPH